MFRFRAARRRPSKARSPLFAAAMRKIFDNGRTDFSRGSRGNILSRTSGSGTAMKLVANTLLGVGMQAIAEAVALASKSRTRSGSTLRCLSHTAVIAPAHAGKLAKARANDTALSLQSGS